MMPWPAALVSTAAASAPAPRKTNSALSGLSTQAAMPTEAMSMSPIRYSQAGDAGSAPVTNARPRVRAMSRS